MGFKVISSPGSGGGGPVAWGDVTGKPTVQTSVGTPGSDSDLVSEQAVREALDAISAVGVTDGNKGDITVLGAGTVWSLNADSVTADKIPDGEITADKLEAGVILTTAELQDDLGVPNTDGKKVDLLFSFLSVSNGTYPLDGKATFPYTIDGVVLDSLNNTATAAVQINGVNVTSLSSLSVTNTLSDTNATGANSVVAGDAVTLVLSAIATTASITGKLRVTRG